MQKPDLGGYEQMMYNHLAAAEYGRVVVVNEALPPTIKWQFILWHTTWIQTSSTTICCSYVQWSQATNTDTARRELGASNPPSCCLSHQLQWNQPYLINGIVWILIMPMTVKSEDLLAYKCCLMQNEFYFIYN